MKVLGISFYTSEATKTTCKNIRTIFMLSWTITLVSGSKKIHQSTDELRPHTPGVDVK